MQEQIQRGRIKMADERQEVMSVNEIALAERIMGFYRRSWGDKHRRGLFDLWENIESYWEGNPRAASSSGDPNSNVNIVHPNIEGQVALLMSEDIEFDVKPVRPSDSEHVAQAKGTLDWVLAKNKLKRTIDMHERRREKFGTGILRVLYDPDAASGGMPIIESVNPAYVFTDPAITDVYKIQQGEFIIETLLKPVGWARGRFGEKRGGVIRSGVDPMNSYIFDENNGGNYLHMMAWMRTDGKLRLVQMSGCGVILSDSFQEMNGESFYPGGEYPYFFTPLYIREGSVWAKGDAELLLSLQDLVDELDDQIRINARLSGNPQRLVDISSNIDLDRWTNESGLIIPTSDIHGVRYLAPPEMPSYPMARRNMALQFERQMVTRFSDQMGGHLARRQTTATETTALLEQGDYTLRHKIALLEDTLGEVGAYVLRLVREYDGMERAFRLDNGDFATWRGSDLKGAEFDVVARLGRLVEI